MFFYMVFGWIVWGYSIVMVFVCIKWCYCYVNDDKNVC